MSAGLNNQCVSVKLSHSPVVAAKVVDEMKINENSKTKFGTTMTNGISGTMRWWKNRVFPVELIESTDDTIRFLVLLKLNSFDV